MSKSITKPKTSKTLLAHLVRLVQATKEAKGPVTATAIESNAIYMARLQAEGLVAVKGTVKTGKRGRPAHLYRATDKGRSRAQRALAKQS